MPQPSIFKNKVFNDGVYQEDIVDVQLHYQLYLAKMGTVEANAPLQAPCTPSKLSECQTDFSVESKKKNETVKIHFNVLPREMVKIMEANEKEEYFSTQHKEYLNKCQMVQNDILEIFISEFK